MSEISELKETMLEAFKEVNQRFNGIDQQFKEVNQRFNGIDQQFKEVNQQFNGIDQQFKEVNQQFNGIDQQFKGIDQQFKEIKEREIITFKYNEKRFDEISKEFAEARMSRMNNSGAIANLSSQVQTYHHEMLALTNRFNRLETKVDNQAT